MPEKLTLEQERENLGIQSLDDLVLEAMVTAVERAASKKRAADLLGITVMTLTRNIRLGYKNTRDKSLRERIVNAMNKGTVVRWDIILTKKK
jgi:hypothetical protein